jgi:glycosyltransferase involved in cell wall biosynthesis
MARPAKINVLFIIKPLRWSGADKVLLEAAARLNQDRYQVIYGVLTENPAEEIQLPPEVKSVRFKMPSLNGVVWLKFFFQLCWVLYKYKIKILHINSYHPGNYGRLAAFLMRVPIIIDHWHGFSKLNHKRKIICRWYEKFTDLSFAVSAGVRDYVTRECQLDPAKFKVLYNCIDYGFYQRGRPSWLVRQELGLPQELPLVGLVARLDHWGKGHKELFTAMSRLRHRYPFHALIVGGGRRQPEMEEMVKDLNLAQLVHFLGNRHDIPDLLGTMEIFVLPSYSEGVSMALLEAMAAGLPVIVSEVGGLPEIVTHGKTGLLVPPRDASALAQSLSQMFDAPEWASSLGEEARRLVQAQFSLERLGRDLNASYDELVERKLRP